MTSEIPVASGEFQAQNEPRTPRPGPTGEPVVVVDDASSMRQGIQKRLPARQRRRQLVGVALTLFAERGFNATTMDDIAEAAGVTKPLLYQHFTSKRALYLELVGEVGQQLRDAIAQAYAGAETARQMVEAGFAAYFRLVMTHEDAFRLLFGSDLPNDPELSGALRAVEEAVAEVVSTMIDAGLDLSHRRLLASAIVGMAEAGCRNWLTTKTLPANEPDEGDIALLARRLADLTWAGLRSVHRE